MQTSSENVYDRLIGDLMNFVGRPVARGIIHSALQKSGITQETLQQTGISKKFINEVVVGVKLFVRDENDKQECLSRLGRYSITSAPNVGPPPGIRRQVPKPPPRAQPPRRAPMTERPQMQQRAHMATATTAARTRPMTKTVSPAAESAMASINVEDDIVKVRSLARNKAVSIGFQSTDQVKIATAVSELARNIFWYAGKGKIELHEVENPRKGLRIVATDNGPGIKNVDEIMSGNYKSKTGLGLGIRGCKKLMDEFKILSSPGIGTTITICKYL